MNTPNGTDMIAATPVTRIVPTMACVIPPPSPTTLRMSLVKNSTSKRLRPFDTTVKTTETSGKATTTNADVTTAVTKRSVARRLPSIRRDTV